MTRTFASLAISALALTTFAVVAPASASDPGEPAMDIAPPRPKLPKVDGEAVYLKTCKKCHAVDGSGDTGMGKRAKEKGKHWPDLRASKQTAKETLETIIKGVDGTPMKAYAAKLTRPELTAVSAYVMSLHQATPTPEETPPPAETPTPEDAPAETPTP